MQRNECCTNCKNKMDLVKLDYSGRGCIHTKYDGFACTIFASEGQINHMVGLDPDTGMCECFTPIKEAKDDAE